jgi:effector-binding domain-containing protein
MELIQPPRVVARPELAYVGIRLVTPFRGMLSVRDQLMSELDAWLKSNGIEDAGSFFLRLHVIDMNGPMDLEVGVMTPGGHEDGDDRVRPGALPAGDYATLTYRDHAIRANRALLEWVRENGLTLDRSDDAAGDRFACRYEAYLTDPRIEPRKTKWHVELNLRLVRS